MNFFLRHIKNNYLLYILVLLFSWVFFYNLDYLPLYSWDEGWYGAIARQIVKTGDFVYLSFNQQPYYDHPPMGFWLMALSFRLFGINEYAARMPSALSGIFTMVILYLLGKKLFNKYVGFIAAFILGTCVWYVIRVRSGNLDALFLFFYTGTVYFALLSSERFRWFPLTCLFLGSLIMTKTLVGFSAVILVLFLIYPQLFHLKRNWIYILVGFGMVFIITFPWYRAQFSKYNDFYQHHFVHIGTRDKGMESLGTASIKYWEKTMFYIHMGVRKWYYLWIYALIYLIVQLSFNILTLFIGLLIHKPGKKIFAFILYIHDRLIIKNKANLLLLLWISVVTLPFLASENTEIWHLIPVYAPLALILAGGMYSLGTLILSLYIALSNKFKIKIPIINKTTFVICYLMAFLYLSLVQTKIFRSEVFPTSRFIPDEIDILKKSASYQKILHVDRDYIPVAVFYSGHDKVIDQPRESSDAGTIKKVFDTDEDFMLVSRNSAIIEFNKLAIPYKILEKNDSYSLITK